MEEKKKTEHSSDCAVHNMPAEKNGECDCGFKEVLESEISDVR